MIAVWTRVFFVAETPPKRADTACDLTYGCKAVFPRNMYGIRFMGINVR